MKSIILIAAIGKNRELGANNDLIWHMKEDMKFFRDTTINHPIVMGRKTYLSLPKLLPKRTHIILTRSDIDLPEEVIKFNSIEEFIKYAKSVDDTFYIIGGGTIYSEFMPLATEMILTEIDDVYPEADTFFPEIDDNLWSSNVIGEYQENDIKYLRKVYKRNDK